MNLQNVIGLIVALLVGAAVGWLVSRRATAAVASASAGAERESLGARLRGAERDLEAVRAELTSQSNTLSALKNELVNTSAELKSREVESSVLEERIKALEPLEDALE